MKGDGDAEVADDCAKVNSLGMETADGSDACFQVVVARPRLEGCTREVLGIFK